MAKITSEILAAIAPGTKKDLRDRFLDNLNETLPVYDIVSALEVRGFLTTACFESDHFKTLREYGKGTGRAYGKPDKITGLIYYGRGIFQNTWKKGYQAFTDYVAAHWDIIKERAGLEESPNFVQNPELLATEFWAVEAACWYWERNHLARYARRGLDGFFGLQGLVNRGSAAKEALDYPDRLQIYKASMRAIPDDFVLDNDDSTAAPVEKPATTDPASSESPQSVSPEPVEIKQPPINEEPKENILIEHANKVLAQVDGAGDKWKAIQATAEKFGVSDPSAARSKGTIVMTVLKWILSGIMLVLGFVKDNWEYLVLAAFLIALAVILWDRSGKRVASAKAGVPVDVLEGKES